MIQKRIQGNSNEIPEHACMEKLGKMFIWLCEETSGIKAKPITKPIRIIRSICGAG